MSNIFDADYTDDECTTLKLEDGRVALHFDGVDHRATPQEVAKCIQELESKMGPNTELVEVILGDDCLWWAVVPLEQ